MSKTEMIKIRVNPELKAALDAVAASRGQTVSAILRQHMEDLTKHTAPALD
jgi:predicted transcriptional regulator